MSEQFSIGEIAILQNIQSPFDHLNGAECQIVDGLALRRVRNIYGFSGIETNYVIAVAGMEGAVEPYQLRKRRPPTTGEQMIRDLFVPTAQPVKEGESA